VEDDDMALTNAGLLNNGQTAHCAIVYDSAIPNGLALASGLQAGCEQDFALMKGWFGGIELIFPYPILLVIANASGGGSWSDPSDFQREFHLFIPIIILNALNPAGFGPAGQTVFLRFLLVAEMTEMFMASKQNGWFENTSLFSGADEGSKGEGLSRFLASQFLLANGLGKIAPPSFTLASQWLNSPRADFVNNNPDDNNADPTNGCTTLFLWYLFDQLRFDPHSIVAAGSATLAGVYQNLTGRSDAFGAFSGLVNSHFPPGFTYNPAGDSIFPVPELAQFFAPNQITTGYSGSTLIFIDRSALAEVNIALISDDPTLVQVPATVTVPIGATATAVTISSTAIPIPFSPRTVNVHASYAGRVLTIGVEVVPPRVVAVSLAPDTVTSGGTATGTVVLNRPSLLGDVVVDLVCGAPGFATVPTQVTVPQNQDSASFPITTRSILIPFNPAHATIVASYVGSSAQAVLTVNPQVIAGILDSLTLFPNVVTAGLPSQGTVTLAAAVPTSTLIGLAASDLPGLPGPPAGGSSVASVPATITIPAGQTTGSFTISTNAASVPLGSHRGVQILAAAVTVKFALLKVTP
jgi:hypothetical protein